MSNASIPVAEIKRAIRNIPDFPKPGIQFKDLTPVWAEPRLFAASVEHLLEGLEPGSVDVVAGIEARGFIFGAATAFKLEVGFVPIRKQGKLPYRTLEQSYELEYGSNTIAVHADAVQPGARVLLLDDLLATGGTAWAAATLLTRLQARIVRLGFLVELSFLHGREHLADWPVHSLIVF